MVIALVLLAVGLAANVILGPLGLGLIEWRLSANSLNQTYGADAATLLLVVPVALAAARLWWRGHLCWPFTPSSTNSWQSRRASARTCGRTD